MSKRRSQGEGSIYFDESRDRWVGQVWIDGRRRKVSARTKLDATAKLGKLLHGDEAERHVDRKSTVATVLEDWLAKSLAGRDIAPSTREVHRWAANLWIAQIGSVKLSDLNVDKVEAALGRMAASPLSRASLVKARSTLRQALAWAERRRAITHNPAATAELPTDAAPAKPRRALTEQELRQLIGAMDGHPLGPMFLLSARCGLRPGEAAGVCRDAVDLNIDPPTVFVFRAVQLANGTPRLVETLKTVGARRTLALPSDVAEALILPDVSEGLLFARTNGGPLWPSTVRTDLAALCHEAGIDPVTPNELRHTAATMLANAGLPPHHVADILGHRSTRMVDAVYRHRPAVIMGAEVVELG